MGKKLWSGECFREFCPFCREFWKISSRNTVPIPLQDQLSVELSSVISQSTFQNDVMAESSRSRLVPSTPAIFTGRPLLPTLETSPPTQNFVLAANSNPQRGWRRRRREIVAVGNLWLAAVVVLFCVAPLPLHSQGTSGSIAFLLLSSFSILTLIVK